MELLLQAGIHLIKKVITFVIYGRSVQVSKACTLFYFLPDFILFIWSFHYLIIPFLYKTKMISLAQGN